MALANAHEGYEYQDLLTCYFILEEILQENKSEFLIDRKEFSEDKIDDLTIISSKCRKKKQVKYSNLDTNHRLCKNDLSSESAYKLSIDTLYFAWVGNAEKYQSEFRICLAWLPPTDTLLEVLNPLYGKGTFSQFDTTVYQIDGEKLWPKNARPLATWQRFKKASQNIERSSFLDFCSELLIEVSMPKLSLNLSQPGALESIVIQQSRSLGMGTYPNEHYREETFILALLGIVKRSRSKTLKISTEGIFHELNIVTDYGSIEQQFPIVEHENIQRFSNMEVFIENHKDKPKLLLLGEPGSGKSWFIENLTTMLKKKGINVLRHFCYIKLDDTFQKERIKLNVFYGNLISELLAAYPALKHIKQKKYASNLNELNHLLLHITQPTYLFIDGLDHIDRIASFRKFSDVTQQDIAIIETIGKLQTNPNVKIVVTSQHIGKLELITSFEMVALPAWSEQDVKYMLKKRDIKNIRLKKSVLLSEFLLEKSSANPLYLKYLIDEVAKIQLPSLTQLEILPKYSFNLSEYYTYLLSQLNTREEVPQVLSGVGFSLTKTELEEITGAGEGVAESLEILSPVLSVNISQSGYRIYHESFRRFILEHLSGRGIAIDKKVFNPIREWLAGKNFFIYRKSYRYYLQFLFEGGHFDDILKQLSHTFVTDSKINGYSWELIERNYYYFVKAACNQGHFPSIVLLNEIDKVLASCKEDFEQLFSLYIETLGKIFGFHTVSEYLIFEGMPALPALQGLEACYICDENQTAAPWQVYIDSFPPGSSVNEGNFKYYLRAFLVLQDEKRLNKLAKNLSKKMESKYAEIFRLELSGFSNSEFISRLLVGYPRIDSVLQYKQKPKIDASRDQVLKLAEELLGIDSVHSSEAETIFNFIWACKFHPDDEQLHETLVDLFKANNWFYNWLIYTIKINRLSVGSAYGQVKEAFDYLAYNTEPFLGNPRTCDLYSIHGFIYQSIYNGLKLIETTGQWKETIDTLVKVSDETTTTLQRSTNGALATDKLFGILSAYTCAENAEYINTIFEKQLEENEEYRLHSDIAEYNLRLASLAAEAKDKNRAHQLFTKAIEFALGYTMRKDQTLRDLILGIREYAKISPKDLNSDLKLSKMLVDSAVDHTDGRETDYFPNLWFQSLLMIDQDISLAYLLHQLKSSRYDWRAEKSLADLLIHLQGAIDPQIESFLALSLPMNTDSTFISYCLNLYEQLKYSHPELSGKLASMIIPVMQPKQNRQRGEILSENYNNSIGLQYGQVPIKKDSSIRRIPKKKWYECCVQRKEFNRMSEEELLQYFDEAAFEEKDLYSLAYLLDSINGLSEQTCELVSTIVSRNNSRYDDKLELDWVFATGCEIECYYWVCRFLSDRGGWFEKFINQEAFLKAYAINPKLAFDKLFELLPNYLEVGMNTEFSSNLLKLLVSLDYDHTTIEASWNNLKTMSAYRLPVQQPIDWAEEIDNSLGMDGDELLLSMLICRLRAGTILRYRLTTAALDSIMNERPQKLIKPFQWFFGHRNSFEKSAEIIILQFIYDQNQKDPAYANHFKHLLTKDYPSRYFLTDWIISALYGLKISTISISKGVHYRDLHPVQFRTILRRNRRFSVFEMQWIDLGQAFSKHEETYYQQYEQYFKLYGNQTYKRVVPHIYSAEHMLQIFNEDYYGEFSDWAATDSEESLRLGNFLATDAIATYHNAMTTRPIDLNKPHLLPESLQTSDFEEYQGWIRIAHTEQELKEEGIFELRAYRSFGGTVFSLPHKDQSPYSPYMPFPFQLWSEKMSSFNIDSEIIFAIIQDDPIEFYRLLWINPNLLSLMGLKTKRVAEGLIATNEKNEAVLKMRSWCCNYIADDFHTRLADEIPTLEGTDLVIRPDYFERLKVHFKMPPIYHTETMREKKKKWQA
jgi:nucleoside-triphosphatase THEP1